MNKISKRMRLMLLTLAAIVTATAIYLIVKASEDFQIDRGILVRYRGTEAHVVIPEGVTEIGRLAFQDCDTIRSVVIPNGVKSIGEGAFANCSSLKTVEIAQSVETIEKRAFAYNFLLEEVSLPERLDVINTETFYGCRSLKSISMGANVKEIGDYAFYQCQTLENVVIPNRVGKIGNSAFSGCENISQVVLPEYNLEMGTNVFANCSSLKAVTLPKNIKSINNGLFWGCESLTVIQIPEGVLSIGDRAFYGCESLVECVFPDKLAAIGEQAFYECRNLRSISLPTVVVTPSYLAKRIQLKLPVTDRLTIAADSFAKCSSLDNITIPAHTLVDSTAFSECTSLQQLRVDPQHEEYIVENNVLYSQQKDILILYPAGLTQTAFQIPGDVKVIAKNAFAGAINLKTITGGAKLKRIEAKAFSGCIVLQNVSLNKTLEYIGFEAFGGCEMIAEFFIPADCQMEADILRDCDSLKKITVDPKNRYYYSEDGVLFDYYQYNLLLYPPKKQDVTYEIPAKVKTISEYAFANNSYLTELTIPDSVSEIQRRAFAYCFGLRKISLTDSVEVMASEVFYGIEKSVLMQIKAKSEKCIPVIYADNIGMKWQLTLI